MFYCSSICPLCIDTKAIFFFSLFTRIYKKRPTYGVEVFISLPLYFIFCLESERKSNCCFFLSRALRRSSLFTIFCRKESSESQHHFCPWRATYGFCGLPNVLWIILSYYYSCPARWKTAPNSALQLPRQKKNQFRRSLYRLQRSDVCGCNSIVTCIRLHSFPGLDLHVEVDLLEMSFGCQRCS